MSEFWFFLFCWNHRLPSPILVFVSLTHSFQPRCQLSGFLLVPKFPPSTFILIFFCGPTFITSVFIFFLFMYPEAVSCFKFLPWRFNVSRRSLSISAQAVWGPFIYISHCLSLSRSSYLNITLSVVLSHTPRNCLYVSTLLLSFLGEGVGEVLTNRGKILVPKSAYNYYTMLKRMVCWNWNNNKKLRGWWGRGWGICWKSLNPPWHFAISIKHLFIISLGWRSLAALSHGGFNNIMWRGRAFRGGTENSTRQQEIILPFKLRLLY